MIKKFLSKYILEVIPSIVATVVGAYIVTHYINAKDTDKPKAAIAAPAETSKDIATEATKNAPKPDDTAQSEKAARAEKAAQVAKAAKAEAAQKAAEAKAEKAATEKAAADKASAEKVASEKAAAEKRERERPVAKSAPVAPPASEANAVSDDKRDANDLARAAIDRLRNAEPRQPELRQPEQRAQEAAREPKPQERARVNSVVYAPAVASQQPAVQPLPPAVTVAPQPSEAAIVAPPAPFPKPDQGSSEARLDDSSRLSPPADIPSRPVDLRARQGRTSVAEDVFSAAKSVFHAVVPEPTN